MGVHSSRASRYLLSCFKGLLQRVYRATQGAISSFCMAVSVNFVGSLERGVRVPFKGSYWVDMRQV